MWYMLLIPPPGGTERQISVRHHIKIKEIKIKSIEDIFVGEEVRPRKPARWSSGV